MGASNVAGRSGDGGRSGGRDRSPRNWRRILGLGAMAAGLALIGVAAAIVWEHLNAPPVYQYVVGETLPAAELGALAPLADKQIAVRRARIVSADQTSGPLAELEVAESPAGPVLVKWQPRIDDPFLTLIPSQAETTALAAVLERHMPAGGTVLAWWDSSRQLRMLSGAQVVFGEHLGTPLFVPTRWRASRSNIETIERRFWNTADEPAELERFRRFTDALLANEEQGMAELRALADGKPAVLVLHARDAILLGQLAPDRIGVAFRDFGALGDVHSMVRRVRSWLDENKYPAYTVLQDPEQPVRALALTDEQSGNTLAARLLPFLGNDQRDVKGATLVYRVGGYCVYELEPQAARVAATGAANAPDDMEQIAAVTRP